MHPGAAPSGIDWTPWHIALVVLAVAMLLSPIIVVPRLMRYYAFSYPKRYPRSFLLQWELPRLVSLALQLLVCVVFGLVFWFFW